MINDFTKSSDDNDLKLMDEKVAITPDGSIKSTFTTDTNVKISLKKIVGENIVRDLNRFYKTREINNSANMVFIYLVHIVQTAGIFITSLSTGMGYTGLVWAGIALNAIASLIQIFEKIGESNSKRIMLDIEAILNHKYVDESPVTFSNTFL